MKKAIKVIAIVLCLVFAAALVGCGNKTETNTDSSSANPAVSTTSVTNANAGDEINYSKPVFVDVKVQDMGEFTLELYHDYAPITVENFVRLASSGFYNGTIFHRVVEGFMAQGGSAINGNAVAPIKGEFPSNGFSKNTLKHERGTISMARATEPDSATSQFFICYEAVDYLDGNYAAFGKVIKGMDVVDKFNEVEKSMNSIGEKAIPVEDIVIESMSVYQ